MRKNTLIVVIGIAFLGLILRIYLLGEVPAGFHRDEAFLGYNAYSILNTGRDMNGNFLPLHLKSFVYTPSGYSYFSIPFIILFGLNEFSVRFASAFFGFLTIVLTYFLVKELLLLNLFHKIKEKINVNYIALFSSFFLAISPWHINLSRTASVITLVVFFISLGTYFYIIWVKNQKNRFIFLSFIFFGISLLFYVAPYSFLPIFIPVLFLFLGNKFEVKKTIKIILLFIFLIILPLLFTLKSPELSLRARSISILNREESKLTLEEQIREDGVLNANIYETRFFHNKILEYSSIFLNNYFKHFSYDFLFSDKGYPDRYRIPLAGLLYILELPLLILGVWFLLNINKRLGLFLVFWVLISPIGSALTFDDVPNLQRTLFIFPALSIIDAFGIYYLFILIPNNYKKVFGLFTIVIFLFNFFSYLHQYYNHALVYRPWYRQDGYKELAAKVNALLPVYKKAVITNHESAPTIFFLFFGRYSPSDFQKDTKNAKMQDFDRIGFGKYEFSQEQCPARIIQKENKEVLIGEKGVLYVNSGLCKDFKDSRILGEIRRHDNSLVFKLLNL